MTGSRSEIEALFTTPTLDGTVTPTDPFVQDQQKIGIGSGSTIVYAVERLGQLTFVDV